jgi:hypothetical protein
VSTAPEIPGSKVTTVSSKGFSDSFGEFVSGGSRYADLHGSIVKAYLITHRERIELQYLLCAYLATLATLTIILAPESRVTAAIIIAGAFAILAGGLAGFTYFKARIPGLDVLSEQADKKMHE